MQNFQVTFFAVVMMLVYACPGYFLVRVGKIKENHIPAFATTLLYVCQPCLTVLSFQAATQLVHDGVSSVREMAIRGGIFLLMTLVLQVAVMCLFYLIFRRRQEEVCYRIFVIASCFGNCGFFGVPMLRAIMPEHPEAAMYSAIAALVMNALCWTVGSAIITRDRKHISLKKVFLNPNTFSAAVALPLFFLNILLPESVGSMVELVGNFSSPLCMLLLGMRLGTVRVRDLFCDRMQYLMVIIKNIAFPLIAFAAVFFLPVEPYLKQVMLILCCCPIANVVLSFAEMLGQGQKTAANIVLLSTISCLVTLPLLCLLLPLLA